MEALSVEGPGTCLDREALTSQVVVWLERDEVDPRLSIVVRDDGPKAPVSFLMRRDDEVIAERRFEKAPAACADRRAAVGLAIALAVDATVLDWLVGPPPASGVAAASGDLPTGGAAEGAPAAEETAAAVTADVVTRLPAPEQGRWPSSLSASAGAALLVAVLPQAVVAASLGVHAATAGWVALRLGVLGTLAARSGLGPGAARSSLLAGRADACVQESRAAGARSPSLRVCAGLVAGSAFARGEGFESSFNARAPWVALAGRGEIALPVERRISVLAAVDILLPVVRPRLDVTDHGGRTVYSRDFPKVGLGAGVGAILRLW